MACSVAEILSKMSNEMNIFPQPQTLVVHPLEYAGKTWQDKVADLRSYLADQGLKGMVVSEGDEVAWLFNMRGELQREEKEASSYASLYQFYPYFDSVALVTSDETRLWLRQDAPGLSGNHVSHQPTSTHLYSRYCFADIEAEMGGEVMLLPFNDSLQDIADWSSGLAESDQVLISSPSLYLGGASYAIYEVILEQSF